MTASERLLVTSVKLVDRELQRAVQRHCRRPRSSAPRGLRNTRRFALGAILHYQLALLCRFQHGLPLRVGLKAFLKAT